MTMADAPRRTRGQAAWGLWLAALAVAGAVALARVPPAMLRSHPATALALLLSAACCGVVAEAEWRVRPWREVAANAAFCALMFFTLAKYADMAWQGEADSPFPLAPRIIRMVMLTSFGVLDFWPISRRPPRGAGAPPLPVEQDAGSIQVDRPSHGR